MPSPVSFEQNPMGLGHHVRLADASSEARMEPAVTRFEWVSTETSGSRLSPSELVRWAAF